MSQRRWCIEVCRCCGSRNPGRHDAPDWEHVVVMPVAEHEELLKLVRGAVQLWDEAHETDNSISLGAAFVGLRKALDR